MATGDLVWNRVNSGINELRSILISRVVNLEVAIVLIGTALDTLIKTISDHHTV